MLANIKKSNQRKSEGWKLLNFLNNLVKSMYKSMEI